MTARVAALSSAPTWALPPVSTTATASLPTMKPAVGDVACVLGRKQCVSALVNVDAGGNLAREREQVARAVAGRRSGAAARAAKAARSLATDHVGSALELGIRRSILEESSGSRARLNFQLGQPQILCKWAVTIDSEGGVFYSEFVLRQSVPGDACAKQNLACGAAKRSAAQKHPRNTREYWVRVLVLLVLQENCLHGLSCGPHEKVSTSYPRWRWLQDVYPVR